MNDGRPSLRQFSLRTIFWLISVVAVGSAAYRWGYSGGLEEGLNQRQQVGTAFARVYDVTGLVNDPNLNSSPEEEGELLVREISVNILPNTWDEKGGDASISYFKNVNRIVVSHDRDGHDRIAEFLKERRHAR